jgi:PPOX class probable F420-dependent enzyme
LAATTVRRDTVDGMDIDQAREFLRTRHRAVLATYNPDGTAQLSPVTVGVDGEGRVTVSTRETAVKTRNLTRDPRAVLCVVTEQFFGEWALVQGSTEIVHMPEALEPLVDYYRRISGEHPDWDEYRQAMVRQGKSLLRVTPVRWGPVATGGFPARLA